MEGFGASGRVGIYAESDSVRDQSYLQTLRSYLLLSYSTSLVSGVTLQDLFLMITHNWAVGQGHLLEFESYLGEEPGYQVTHLQYQKLRDLPQQDALLLQALNSIDISAGAYSDLARTKSQTIHNYSFACPG